ncbi:hypothetical protein A8M77_11695 [Variovorax sp. JS1663]|nr:hypothetical protein A8M77_11695 [Variovorax sp. JS1663]
MNGGHSALYVGRVTHRRLGPVAHRLHYRMFSLLLDLDELPQLTRRLRLFSLDRFNLFSLHQRDHGAAGGQDLRCHVERQLGAAGLETGGPIRLLAMPRILGYAFNPLSVYFCHRTDGDLQAILYEVRNTFGERHCYLIEVDGDQRRGGTIRQTCAKRFHVSPFLGMEMRYGFRIVAPIADAKHLRVAVTAANANGPVLAASFDAQRHALDDGALMQAFLSVPLLTLKVVAAIHWEALRLWAKGLRIHRHPGPPDEAVTIVKTRNP